MQYKYYMSNWTQPGYDPSQHGWRKGVIDGAPYEGWSQNYFFADTLRSIDIAFGLMIHGISVFHTNKEGEPVKQIEVPIKIGPRQKAFDFRVDQKTGKKYYIPLPNITYRRTAMEWDGERAQGRFTDFEHGFSFPNGENLSIKNMNLPLMRQASLIM